MSTPRKTLTKDIQRQYRELINDEFPRFAAELATLHGEKYVTAFLAASKYVIPTISSVKIDENGAVSTAKALLASIAQQKNEL